MKRNTKTCRVGGKSKLRQIAVDDLRKVISESLSYSEAIRAIGLDVKTIYLNTIRELVELHEIDTSHFSRKLIGKNNGPSSIYDNDSFMLNLVKNSKLSSKTLKRGLIFNSLIKHKCTGCGITTEYNGKPIVLQLDHINGINDDNSLENLRWLCPNCHSQSDTFSGRNARKLEIKYCKCGAKLFPKNKTGTCSNCMDRASIANSYDHSRKFDLNKEELEVLIKSIPMVEIGRRFGVSDTAVKKRCRRLGIELKAMRGYWSKIRSKSN
jgi:5-methylcytosine-specific restriction endonuclease McrA